MIWTYPVFVICTKEPKIPPGIRRMIHRYWTSWKLLCRLTHEPWNSFGVIVRPVVSMWYMLHSRCSEPLLGTRLNTRNRPVCNITAVSRTESVLAIRNSHPRVNINCSFQNSHRRLNENIILYLGAKQKRIRKSNACERVFNSFGDSFMMPFRLSINEMFCLPHLAIFFFRIHFFLVVGFALLLLPVGREL